jgi:hypothetical protein
MEKDRDFKKMRKWNPNNPNGKQISFLSTFAATFSHKMGWSIRSKSKFWKNKWSRELDVKYFEGKNYEGL